MPRAKKWVRAVLWSLGLVLALIVAALLFIRFSPWPMVWALRHADIVFGDKTAEVVAAMRKHVPAGVTGQQDIVYGRQFPDSRMDVYYPEHATGPQPVVVWMHGGAFVAGSKNDSRPYLQIIAAHGYTVVGVEYAKGPTYPYPTPLLQLGQAIQYLQNHAGQLHIDPTRVILAGDSAGAQMAAQEALLVTNPDYARASGLPPALHPEQLRGVVLFCGVFDMSLIQLHGKHSALVRNLFWAYLGNPDPEKVAGYRYLSVVDYVTPSYPPVLITDGNGDLLLPHTQHMIATLQRQGVQTDVVLFADAKPALPHEFQLNLDQPPGQRVLAALLRNLASWSGTPAAAGSAAAAP